MSTPKRVAKPQAAAGATSAFGALFRVGGVTPPGLLAGFGLFLWLLVPPVLLALALDGRVLDDGTPVWMKPLKFLVSLGLFALSNAWALTCTTAQAQRSRSAWVVLLLVVLMSVFELGYITWKASLGEASHFNTRDTFHALMYSLMGAGAVVLTATAGMVAWLVTRHGDAQVSAIMRHAIVLGFAMTVVLGIFSGAVMSTQPGHFVGAGAAAATLPLLGWSLVAGDYRVAHFLGMHAQQALPLVALLLLRRPSSWTAAAARQALNLCAIAWTALVAVAYLHAFRGQPFHGG
jgi:hypothetical protein